MTLLSSRARSISEAADALATELAESASKPRKHVVTVVWCEGDEPGDAGISSSIYDTQSLGKDLVFALQAINSAMGRPSSDFDAANPSLDPRESLAHWLFCRMGNHRITQHAICVERREDDPRNALGQIEANLKDLVSLSVDTVRAATPPNPDAVKARTALVRAAKRDVYKLMTDGKWYMRHGARPRDTKAEAVSDNCEWLGCFIDPVEVEAILKGGDGA